MMLDLDRGLPGAETTVQSFPGCAKGSAVELWTIHGGGHIPSLSADFVPNLWAWFRDHPKR